MSKQIAALKKRLEASGASMDQTERTLNLDAPSGYVWVSTGTRTVSIEYSNASGQTWLTKAVKSAEEDIAPGLEKVTDPEEVERHIYDLDEPDWAAPNDAPAFISV